MKTDGTQQSGTWSPAEYVALQHTMRTFVAKQHVFSEPGSPNRFARISIRVKESRETLTAPDRDDVRQTASEVVTYDGQQPLPARPGVTLPDEASLMSGVQRPREIPQKEPAEWSLFDLSLSRANMEWLLAWQSRESTWTAWVSESLAGASREPLVNKPVEEHQQHAQSPEREPAAQRGVSKPPTAVPTPGPGERVPKSRPKTRGVTTNLGSAQRPASGSYPAPF